MELKVTAKGRIEIMSYLAWRLRDDIPVMDYMNGWYGQDIVFDLEAEDHHEIPSRYTKDRVPDAFTRHQFSEDSFEIVSE